MADTAEHYSIKIFHKMDGFKKTFYLFQEAPAEDNGRNGDLFTNVFQVSPSVKGAGNGSSVIQFDMQKEYFAMYGTSSSSGLGDSKVKVSTSAYKAVSLGKTNKSYVALTNNAGTLEWDEAAATGKKSTADGAFEFHTDDTFKAHNKNHIYIGIGAKDPNGDDDEVIPLQTYLAEPSLKSKIYPKQIYYVSTGAFEPGVIVDRKKIGKFAKVDFTGAGDNKKALLDFDDNGDFSDHKGESKANGVAVECDETA